ncbi:MAG: ATP-binding protein [Clostridiales bacterium]|nr:ATP-binding protein [Clostridiales bacterium]
MIKISAELNNLFGGRELQSDEYINPSDGLVYCSKCHTPRQLSLEYKGKVVTPYVMCSCQRAAYEKEEAERKQRNFLNMVSRLKASGLQDKSLYDYNFANDKGINPEIKYAYTYVATWQEMYKMSIGLLLWGSVGTGKSFIAGCIANALLEKGVPVLMTNFPKILNELTGLYSGDRNIFINSLNQYSLLIIDDLGVERNSEFAVEQIFNIVDSRYRSKKPFVITTNFTLDELKHPSDMSRSRIYNRILERCIPIMVNNRNIRNQNAAANMDRALKLFS